MTLVQAIESEIKEAKKLMPWGDPCISFDSKDVFIDEKRQRMTITLETLRSAFAAKERK